MTPGAARAQSVGGASREYQVKAAMLCNFAQFVEWPSDSFTSANAPIVFAVLGDNPFGSTLEQLTAGKSFGGHGVVVRYFDQPAKVGRCHILFIEGKLDGELADIIHGVGGAPTLTVGETDDFCRAGGIIRFFTDENKLRFEIRPEIAEKARLRISSKLLKLARIFR